MSQTHASPSDGTERFGFGRQERNITVCDFRKGNAESRPGARESPRNAMGRVALMKIADGVYELPGGEAQPPSVVGA